MKRGISETKDDVEQEISGQSTLRDPLGDGFTCRDLIIQHSRESGVDSQHTGADKSTDNEDFSSRHSISEADGCHGANGGNDRVQEVVG